MRADCARSLCAPEIVILERQGAMSLSVAEKQH
jgi:hypothetical protein